MKLKVPYFKQERETTCGVASCGMIALLDPAVLYGGLEGFGHFVVIIGFGHDIIWYHDPDLKGDLMRNVSDFMKAWGKFSCKGVRIWKSTKR